MSKSRKWLAGGILGLVALAAIGVLTVTLLTTQPAAAVSVAAVPAVAVDQLAAAQAAPTVTSTATVTPKEASKADMNQYLDVLVKSFASKLGVSEDKLNSAFAEALSETVDQAVKDGNLDQNTATKIKAAAKDGLIKLLPLLGGGVNGKQGDNPNSDLNNQLLSSAVEQVAKLLNTTPDDLKKSLGSGQSLVEIAKAQNVDAQKLKDTMLTSIKTQLDAMVTSGKLTQAQAADFYRGAPNLVDKFINGKPNKADMQNQRFNPKAMLMPALDKVATLLNITSNDLMDKLKTGQSLAQIAQVQHLDVQKVKDTILNDMKAQLEAAVKAGSLTQSQADEASSTASSWVDSFMTNNWNTSPSPTSGKK